MHIGRNVFWGVFAVVFAACGADPVDFVNVFTGTSGNGNIPPGPTWPMGMVQPGPDTGNRYWSGCCGYSWNAREVMGFSQNHLSGTGCPDFQDVAMLPFTRDIAKDLEVYRKLAAAECEKSLKTRKGVPRPAVFTAKLDKESERGEPGYYTVRLPEEGVKVELTASKRVAYHRYTFEKGRTAKIYVNLQSGPQGWWKSPPPDRMRACESAWHGDEGIFDGTYTVDAWATKRTVGFAAVFSPRPAAARKLEPLEGWKGDRWIFEFDLPEGGAVNAKVALSTVDEAGARANLAADPADFDFDARHAACRGEWNRFLRFAEIEASENKKRQFYTALYHCYFQPNVISDVTGRYRDDSGAVVTAKDFTCYSTFSTWDTVRAAHPLYTILTPSLAAAFVNSMIDQQRASGRLSKWPLWGRETGCMVACHSVPVVVDAILKGIPGIDAETAFRAIDETLRDRGPHYDTCGYFPWNQHARSCAVTLEWCLDDWCAARLAEKLGKTERAAFYNRRAGYWKNLFDPETGYMRGKDAQGRWHEPFDPFAERAAGPGVVHDYVEGSAIQYTWHVMQDPRGLIEAFGGRLPFYRALNQFFTLPAKMPGQLSTGEATGRVGQYAHGNEPSHHVAYFFPYVGRPDRTAEIVREICDRYYLDKPDGLCGNDDCGQMSAWFVFACLGFYSFNPCGGEYVLGAPQVEGVTIRLENGKTFRVVAENFSEENKYVKSVTLDGQPYTDFILRHADILKGGELRFRMWDGGPAKRFTLPRWKAYARKAKETGGRRGTAGPGSFTHYRFRIGDGFGLERNSIQLSEFRLLDGTTDVTARRKTAKWGTVKSVRPGQEPLKALDGKLDTKWLDMGAGAGDAPEGAIDNLWLEIEFAEPQHVTGYDWATANDCPERDPALWWLEGSTDGKIWIKLDQRTIDDIPSRNRPRLSWVAESREGFTLPPR